MSIKVLMQARTNLFTCKGGDTIQILKTKEYLEKLGVEVTLSTNIKEDLNKYDIIHLFNLTRVQETYSQILNAKEANKPVVLSTIYWPTDELELYGQGLLRRMSNRILGVDTIEKLKVIAKYFKDENSIDLKTVIKNNYFEMQKKILSLADWLLPNSKYEILEINKKFHMSLENYSVVVNAIEQIENNSGIDENLVKYKDCILCIGRIEPRKNQLSLVNALKNTEYSLVIVGASAPNHKAYYDKVKKAANNKTVFIDYIDNKKIYELCRVAKVHILPSWYETPGLVSLEAAYCGCNIVVTDKGTTKDYFKDMAYYCKPDDLNSIRMAVEDAFNARKNNMLSDFIKTNYTWEKAASQTLESYKSVMSGKVY